MSTYTIKKGNHYHSNIGQRLLFWPHKFKDSSYRISFGHNCWYYPEAIPGIADDNDKNKLHGLRYWNDHINSGAIAWRPNFERPGYIDLYIYGYSNKKRYNPHVPIATIRCGVSFISTVSKGKFYGKPAYFFSIDNTVWAWIQDNPKAWARRQPFFGGDPTAPWDMDIIMEKIQLEDWVQEIMIPDTNVITI